MSKLHTISNAHSMDIWYGGKWVATAMGPHTDARCDRFPDDKEMKRLAATIMGALLSSGDYPNTEA